MQIRGMDYALVPLNMVDDLLRPRRIPGALPYASLWILSLLGPAAGCEQPTTTQVEFVEICYGDSEPRKSNWSTCSEGLVLACVDGDLVELTCSEDLARRFPDRQPSPPGIEDALHVCLEGEASCMRRKEFCHGNLRVNAFAYEAAYVASGLSPEDPPPESTVLENCGSELTCIDAGIQTECFDCTPHCEGNRLVRGCLDGEPLVQDCRAQSMRCTESASTASCAPL